MFNEKDFKNYILGMKIKKLLCMLIFSIIGCAIGVITSSYIIDILLFDWNLRPIIIAAFTIIFFFISLLITSNSNRYIQDSYLKMETLNTLNKISTKLDNLELKDKNNELETHSAVIEKIKDTISNDKPKKEKNKNNASIKNDNNSNESSTTKEEMLEEIAEENKTTNEKTVSETTASVEQITETTEAKQVIETTDVEQVTETTYGEKTNEPTNEEAKVDTSLAETNELDNTETKTEATISEITTTEESTGNTSEKKQYNFKKNSKSKKKNRKKTKKR